MSNHKITDEDGDVLTFTTTLDRPGHDAAIYCESRSRTVILTRDALIGLHDAIGEVIAGTAPEEPLAAWERELGRIDARGAQVYVTGDTDGWGHGFATGTLVTVVSDDLFLDGSYEVEDGYGDTKYVAASDLDVYDPTALKVGDNVRVIGNSEGNPGGIHHFPLGQTVTVRSIGEHTIEAYGYSPEFGISTSQYVLPEDLAPFLPLDEHRPGDSFPNVAYVRSMLGREVL